MKTVVVTGAGGYIGMVLVKKLLDKLYRVIAIDRYSLGQDQYFDDHKYRINLKVIKVDCTKIEIDHFVGAYCIIDLASITNEKKGELKPNETYRTNHFSRVMNAKKAKKLGVHKYILASTCAVYGISDGITLLKETSNTNPLSTYARAALDTENDVIPMANQHFTVIVVRPGVVYGYSPKIRLDLSLNAMVYNALNLGKLLVLGDGEQWRPFIHVNDVTNALVYIMELKQELTNKQIINLVSENYQLKTVANKIMEVVPIPLAYSNYGEKDLISYLVSAKKLLKTLGFYPNYTIKEGITELYQHYYTNASKEVNNTNL